ncbi:hypothetical protein D3C72_846150 [compost metagenome]
MRGEVAVHLDGGQGAAVQTETVAFLAGGKTVGKDPRHVFRGDAFAVVLDADFKEVVIDNFDRQGHGAWAVAEVGHGVFSVADEVDQDQQQTVFVAHHLRHVSVLPDHRDVVPGECPGVHAQRVFEQFVDEQRFGHAVGAGIGLLGGDDVFDVVDAFVHLVQLVEHFLLFLGNGDHQLVEVAGEQFALGVFAEEHAEFIRVFVDQLHGLAQALGLAVAQLARDQVAGNVHAIEHVADVVQHIGGDFRHAGLTCRVEQFALGVPQFPGAFFDSLFQCIVGGLQGVIDPVDLGETTDQTDGQPHQRQHQQDRKQQQVEVVLPVDLIGALLIAIEHGGDVVEAVGHGDVFDAFEQLIDHRLLARNQRNMAAHDSDRGLKRERQALCIDLQFVQADLDVGGPVVGGDLGEFEGAEQQVVGVGGDVLQLQFIEVRQAGQLLLDVVFSGGQKSQGVA